MQTWDYIWEIGINFVESFLLIVYLEDKLIHSNKFNESFARHIKIIFIVIDTVLISLLNFLEIPFEVVYIVSLMVYTIFTILLYEERL